MKTKELHNSLADVSPESFINPSQDELKKIAEETGMVLKIRSKHSVVDAILDEPISCSDVVDGDHDRDHDKIYDRDNNEPVFDRTRT